MGKLRFTAEQIIHNLLQTEVALAKGLKVTGACRKLGVSEKTYCRLRKEYGGLGMEQAKRLEQLEMENTLLKRMLADLNMDRSILENVILNYIADSKAKLESLTRDGFIPLDPRQGN